MIKFLILGIIYTQKSRPNHVLPIEVNINGSTGIMSMYGLPTAMNFMFIFSGVALGYELGQIVRRCNFENARWQLTGCSHIHVYSSHLGFSMNNKDTSARDGPAGDHTSGRGACMN